MQSPAIPVCGAYALIAIVLVMAGLISPRVFLYIPFVALGVIAAVIPWGWVVLVIAGGVLAGTLIFLSMCPWVSSIPSPRGTNWAGYDHRRDIGAAGRAGSGKHE